MGKNWAWLLLLAAIAIVYGFIGVPWANQFGHWWISVIVYAALLLAAVYCRCNPEPIHSKVFHRKVRRTPQSL